jgi:protein-tyrosine-phosphatase
MRRTNLEKNILFLGEDNACLSLMAESMAKHMSPPKARVFSAGITPGRVPPEVRRVLEEIGVKLADSPSKSVDQVPLKISISWFRLERLIRSAFLFPPR